MPTVHCIECGCSFISGWSLWAPQAACWGERRGPRPLFPAAHQAGVSSCPPLPMGCCLQRQHRLHPGSAARVHKAGHHRRDQLDTGWVFKPEMGFSIKNGNESNKGCFFRVKQRFLQPSVSSFVFPVKSNTIWGFGKKKKKKRQHLRKAIPPQVDNDLSLVRQL